MKCLLISLQSNAYVTGLKYIAANLLDKGHDARILLLPGYLEQNLDPAIENFIKDYNPDLIGIGLMSIEYYPAKNVTRLLREKFKIPTTEDHATEFASLQSEQNQHRRTWRLWVAMPTSAHQKLVVGTKLH